MNDGESPRSATITYAVISVLLRLISAQCAVFVLWYGRRAYERSRGEMMTMLYEKTLNRKIIGAKQAETEQPAETETQNHTNGDANANQNGQRDISRQGNKAEQGFIQRLFHNIRSLFQTIFAKKSKSESKVQDQAASMGKILNLMR